LYFDFLFCSLILSCSSLEADALQSIGVSCKPKLCWNHL
jgi:hypothetical protein